VAIGLLLVGCTRTHVTSFTDPQYQGSSFGSVIILGDNMGLDERQTVENTARKLFQAKGITSLRALDIIPPTRTYSKDEFNRAIRATGVQTILVIALTGKDTSETYIPSTYIPGSTYGTVSTLGNTSYISIYQNPGYTVGGYSVSKPHSAYAIALYDVNTDAMIWKADARSAGGATTRWKKLAKAVTLKAVKKLLRDGLFAPQ
jgi:hypothetical protein